MRYKLVAIDLDGTLLDSRNAIPAANRDALHRAHAAGVQICVSTGRSFTECEPILRSIGLELDYVICACGALVSRAGTGETLMWEGMDAGVAHQAARLFVERGVSVAVLHDAWTAGLDYSLIRGDSLHAGLEGWLTTLKCKVREMSLDEPWPAPPLRVTVVDDVEPLPEYTRWARSAFDRETAHMNAASIPSLGISILELFSPRVNKRFGLERLCARMGIRMEETAAIGDGVNDVELIDGAGLGVVMANGCAEAKAVANVEAPANDDHGVAVALEKMLAGAW